MGNAMAPAHSPNIAHACVQSSGVLALHPSRGVRSSPPLIASAGSSGTAVVARKLARLSWSAVTQSSADLRLAGWAIRRAFGAGGSLGEELWAAAGGMNAAGVFWSPKSQCVYGPENEIAAVTFFCEKWRSFTKKQYFLQV